MSKSQTTYADSYTPFPKNFGSAEELCSPGSIIDIQEFGHISSGK